MFVNLGRAGRSVRASMQEKDIPSCIGSSADYWMEYHRDGIRCLEWEWQSRYVHIKWHRNDEWVSWLNHAEIALIDSFSGD